LTFVGPGKNAAGPATISAAVGASAINIDPTGSSSARVVVSGLRIIGNGNASVVSCNGSGGSVPPQLTIVDSSVSGGSRNELVANACTVTVRTSTFSGAGQAGVYLGPGSAYSIQNCFIFGNVMGVSFQNGSAGTFSFNTVAYNTGPAVDCAANATLVASIIVGNKQSGGSQLTGTLCSLTNTVTSTDSYNGAIQLSPALTADKLHLDTTPGVALTQNQACCVDKIGAPPPSPLPTIDVDNQPRPQGVSWDIGADEAL
jgi:hypothetical protein